MPHYQVIIIGAGFAGLSAARTLIRHGITNIKVLEAQQSPGGRASTLAAGDGIIEMGAQWMHDDRNELHRIMQQNDLIHNVMGEEALGVYLREDGRVCDAGLVAKVDFNVGKFLTECEVFVDADSYPKSIGDFIEMRFGEFLGVCSEGEREEARALYDWHVRFQVIDNSCECLRHLSARAWGLYATSSEDGQSHLNFKGGCCRLIRLLVPEGDVCTYNVEVRGVQLKDDLVEINWGDFSADYVIITASIGVLKANLGWFSGGEAAHLRTAIQAFGFGAMGKVYLEFAGRWWSGDGFQLVWLEGGAGWTRHLTGFDVVLGQPRMLVGWLGDLGVAEMERLSEEEVGRDCVDVLRRFLRDDSVPYPEKVYKSNWKSNPFIRGGYSHTTPENDRTGTGPETLRRPVYSNGTPRIFLAGEAAHTSHFSTMHGAYESGQEQAELVAKHIKSSDTSTPRVSSSINLTG